MDSGNLMLPGQVDRVGLMMVLLGEMHYDAIGVGQNDLSLGATFYEEAAKNKVAVVDASPGAPDSAVAYLLRDVGGVKIGVVSFGAVRPEETTNEFARRKALYGAYTKARHKCDLLIVLDQANVVTAEWLEGVGKRLGVPDVVIPGNHKAYITEPEVIGSTYICPTSTQGRNLGVVDVEFTRGAEPVISWSRTELNEKVEEDTAVKSRIDAVIHAGAVATAPVQAATAPPASVPPVPTAGGKPYYSPALCKSCHAKVYEDWAATKHAAAIKTLMNANRMVPECLPCHSEQYRRIKTVSIPADGIGGVECATCHMESLPHGLERKAVQKKTRVSGVMCWDCHTKERSPGYDEQVYFPKISHLESQPPISPSVSPQ